MFPLFYFPFSNSSRSKTPGEAVPVSVFPFSLYYSQNVHGEAPQPVSDSGKSHMIEKGNKVEADLSESQTRELTVKQRL